MKSLAASLAFLMLLQSSLFGVDYATYNNVLFCLNTQVDQPGRYWEQAIGGSPAIPSEFVRQLEMGITNRRWQSANSGADANRPQVVTGGGILTGTITGSRFMFFIDPSTGASDPCRVIHQNGVFDLWISFQSNASLGTAQTCILDSTNFSTTALGFYLAASNAKLVFRLNNGNATPAVTFTSLEDVNDNTRHTAHIRINTGNGACSMRVDKGTRQYGTLGSLNAGTVAFPLAMGGRVGGQTANDFEGTIWGMVGSVGPISSSQEAEFIAGNPYGNITGFPEMRCGLIHLNLNSTYYYVPTYVYYNGLRMSDPTDADGAVYAWDDSSGWQGSGHGADPPPAGGETVISKQASIDGGAWTTVVPGDDLVGTSSVSFERVTSTVAFSEQRHTVTIEADGTKYDHIRMVKNSVTGVSGGLMTTYPIRNSRDVSFTAWRAYDANGAYLREGTLTTSSSLTHMDADVKHIAQWSSTLNTISLVMMTKGEDTLGFRHLLIGVPQNMRNYQEVYYGQVPDYQPSDGEVIELASTTKWITSTAGAWKATADAAVLAYVQSLPPDNVPNKVGIGVGVGLSNKTIKVPDEYAITN